MTVGNAVRVIGWSAAALWIASPSLATLPDDVRPGTRVEAEGQRLDDSTFTAEEVEIQAQRTGKDEISGRITAVDAAAGTLRIHGVNLKLNADAEVEDDDGTLLKLSDFAVGQYAGGEGVYRDGVLHTEELERGEPDPGEELKVELAGAVSKINRAASSFEILGIEVLVTGRTVIEMK